MAIQSPSPAAHQGKYSQKIGDGELGKGVGEGRDRERQRDQSSLAAPPTVPHREAHLCIPGYVSVCFCIC